MMTRQPITADHIRYIRSQLGLSQSQLASTLGVTAATVARWEQNVMEPSGDHLVRLQRMLATANYNDADAYAASQRDTGGCEGRAAYDAHWHAERAGLSPGAAFFAGRAAEAYAFGDSETQFLFSRGAMSREKMQQYITELQAVGLWPWE